MDLTVCPQCSAPAEVEWRSVLESTDGPVEHAKVLCVNQHWFLLPLADLADRDQAVLPDEDADRATALTGDLGES
jgi:hypothetical protein